MSDEQIKICDVLFRKTAGGNIKSTLTSSMGDTIPNMLFDEVVRLRNELFKMDTVSDPFIFVGTEQVPVYIRQKENGMWVAVTSQEPYFCIEGASRQSVEEEVKCIFKSYKEIFG